MIPRRREFLMWGVLRSTRIGPWFLRLVFVDKAPPVLRKVVRLLDSTCRRKINGT
jgi:hypothetical protein